MPNRRLLDRQASLITHLTSPSAYTAGAEGGGVLDHAGLKGLDAGRLALVGALSLTKRIDKIEVVLAKTFAHLDARRESWIPAFADACPPHTATRYDNAQQFYGFLCERWRDEPPDPPYLRDLAAYEMAFARVRFFAGTTADTPAPVPVPAFRRHPDAELLRCEFDIRPLFDETVAPATPERRDVWLVISCPDAAFGPRVFEVAPEIFDMLDAAAEWQMLNPGGAAAPGAGAATMSDLAARGMIETCL